MDRPGVRVDDDALYDDTIGDAERELDAMLCVSWLGVMSPCSRMAIKCLREDDDDDVFRSMDVGVIGGVGVFRFSNSHGGSGVFGAWRGLGTAGLRFMLSLLRAKDIIAVELSLTERERGRDSKDR